MDQSPLPTDLFATLSASDSDTPPSSLRTSSYDFEPTRLSFIEDPAVDLIDRPIHEMSDDELAIMLSEISELNQKPGALTTRMQNESVAITTGQKRTSTKKSTLKASAFI